jgi:hypothetical protein
MVKSWKPTGRDWVADATAHDANGIWCGNVFTEAVYVKTGAPHVFLNTGCFIWDSNDPTQNVKAIPTRLRADYPRGGFDVTTSVGRLEEARAIIDASTRLTSAQKADLLNTIDKTLQWK